MSRQSRDYTFTSLTEEERDQNKSDVEALLEQILDKLDDD